MRFPLEHRRDGWHILAVDEHGTRDLGTIGRVSEARAYDVRSIVADAWARGWVQGERQAEAGLALREQRVKEG